MMKCHYKFYTILTSFLIVLFALVLLAAHHLTGLRNDTKEVTRVDIPAILLVAEVSGKYQQLLKQILLAYHHNPKDKIISPQHDHAVNIHIDAANSLVDQLYTNLIKIKTIKSKHKKELAIIFELALALDASINGISSKVLSELRMGVYDPDTLAWFLKEQEGSVSKVDSYIRELYDHQDAEVTRFTDVFSNHYESIINLMVSVSVLTLVLWCFVLYVFNSKGGVYTNKTVNTCTLDGQSYIVSCSHDNVITLIKSD